jgi:hypothetical protein
LEKNTYKKTLIKNHFFYKKKEEEEAKRNGSGESGQHT